MGGDGPSGAGAPSVPKIPVDPNLAQEQADAQENLVNQLQRETRSDMTALMAMYGTRLALSGNTSRSPLSPVPATGTPVRTA